MLLEAREVEVRYGSVRAVRAVSLHLRQGEIVAVLGANGAGKSSLLRALLGMARLAGGTVSFDGVDVSKWPVSARVRAGLVLVPEGRRIVTSLTVDENLLMGACHRRDHTTVRTEIERTYQRFPNLAARRNDLAAVLSGGEQQMLAIGRALLAAPKLMMLDEPSLGLSPILVQQIFSIIQEINARGTTILLVEQNALQALTVAQRGYVLQTGQVVLSGPSSDLRENEMVRKAYLGES